MDRQQQFAAALNAEAALAVARALGADTRPWWQRDDAPAEGFLIAELTDEMIDEAPGFGDFWEREN